MVLSIIAYSLSDSAVRCSKRRCHTPFSGPAAEPLVGVLPVAKPFRQVAPRNSSAVAVEHRFDESTIVAGGDADITGFAGEQVFDSLHWSSRSAYRLMGQPCSKSTLHESHKLL
jgi:hypothetical protein